MSDKKDLQELHEQASQKLEALGQGIDDLEVSPPKPPPGDANYPLVEDLKAEWTGKKLFMVSWNPKVLREPIDIEFYDPEVHEPWQLSVLKYHPGATILSDKGQHPIGLGGSDTDKHNWKIRVVSKDAHTTFKSKPFTLDAREQDKPEPPPEKEAQQYTIRGNGYGRVRGVIDWKGGVRVYMYAAPGHGRDGRMMAYDSKDLKNWEPSEKPEFPLKQKIFQHPETGKIYGFTSENNDAYLWDDFNPDKGCQRKLHKIYSWRIDGTLAPSITKDGFIQLGRVRGYGSEDEGRWNPNNLPPYPKLDNYPAMKEAWEARGNVQQGERWVKDRRGVSLHTSRDGKDWDSRILLDPVEVDLPGFRGWTDKDKNGVGDFYSAVMIDEKRCFLKVYWKQKNRFIDRCDYWQGDCKDYDLRRRFRFTGETTFIPAVLQDGKLEIKSLDSVIPKKLHERVVTKEQVHWATNPGVPEVGQLTPHGRVIYRDGMAHIFYYQRDDIHYEGGWDGQDEGVYVYAMPADEFDALFT